MKQLWNIILLGLLFGSPLLIAKTPPQKQDSSHAVDWVASWKNCGGDGAVKRDGTLWQFGEVEVCDWGQIHPIDPATGEMTKDTYIYHLRGRLIGSGFADAKIINGGYRIYAIKCDGSLWGWGERLGAKPRLLSHSHDWIDFRVKWEGNGCCAHDVGMQRDGSLWRFPEEMHYAHKRPLPYLKKIGKQKSWDKVILDCCSIYAMRSDGTLWQNDGLTAKVRFKKINHEKFCKKHPHLCKKFKKMKHKSLHSTGGNDVIRVHTKGRAGRLWIEPEIIYHY
jgi:hypothetical protein